MAFKKEYYKKCRDCGIDIITTCGGFYCKDCVKERRRKDKREYHKKNKIKLRLKTKKWRLENREKALAAQRNCYYKKHDYYLKCANEYRIKHKEERRLYDIKRKNEEPHRILLIKNKIPIVCKVCGSKENINGIQMSVHHVDGNHNNNILSNVVWICERCHQYVHNPKGINSRMVVIDGYKEEESR